MNDDFETKLNTAIERLTLSESSIKVLEQKVESLEAKCQEQERTIQQILDRQKPVPQPMPRSMVPPPPPPPPPQSNDLGNKHRAGIDHLEPMGKTKKSKSEAPATPLDKSLIRQR